MRKYRLVAKKGEGTFSEVLKAQNVKDGRYHAIKCMKNRFDSIDQVNNLREIQALRRLSPHEHVISLEEVLYDQPTGRLALVFELMDANLYEIIRGRRQYLAPNLVKSYMWQLMKSLDHMHKKGIFHRDIKPENILIESTADVGRGLKLADFGSCRGIYSKQPYTEYISTRWYRAPECLLTDGYYGPEMDLWGAGCVMFEITSLYPLFPGSNEVDQITRIHKILGTPSSEMLAKFKSKGASHISFDFPLQKGVGIPQLIPHATADAIDLVVRLLKYDASERITAREAMRHPYFKEIRDQEANSASEAKLGQSQQMNGGNSGGSVIIPQLQSTAGSELTKIEPKSNPQELSHYSQSKPLPYLNSSVTGITILPDGTQKQLGHASKPSNSIPTTSSTVTNLPPIVNAMGPGGTQFSKFSGPQQAQQMKAAAAMGGNNGSAILSGAGANGNSQFTSSQFNSSQKKKKKYKMPSQQQKQRTAQNSESVLRAYGVPKLDSMSAATGGSVGPSKPYQSIYPPVVQQSSAAAAAGSLGAIGFPNPSNPNRHNGGKKI